MILNISNHLFHQEPHHLNHWFTKSPRLRGPGGGGSDLSGCSLVSSWFNINDTLADSSGMNTQHSVWIITQVPSCEAVIKSKAILFRRTTFLIETFQCSVKTDVVGDHLRLPRWTWKELLCVSCPPDSGRNKDGNQMNIGVEKTCPPGLEEREAGNFRNLTKLFPSYMEAALTGVRRWNGAAYPGPGPSPSPSFHGAGFISDSTFQQVQLAAGKQDPSGDWVAPRHLGVQRHSSIRVGRRITNASRWRLCQVWWACCS